MKLTFITGGQRSGKSSFAQDLALKNSSRPVYLATSRIWDDEHKKRIDRHKADRDHRWENIEEEKYLSTHSYNGKVVLVDCITLWLTNFFFDNKSDIDTSLNEAKKEFEKLVLQDAHFIIVSNEIGLGGMPENEIQRKFTDLQGWMNQYIAAKANEVFMMVSGIPMKVK
ncbi:bifunctional adenosylcobinamide kinase/adenosylcobinamide-phosphate guanylyltransferase [Plebeiibacterium marinum]|uniref:Adenosylcobinamide kinase n=1 Tax=Plebeiibacterium marinum TaxID=2992111 RepID=A0AAE3MCP2_9BACT|nr:bifunctional adenosylcobinamide kinase/adenosylcobinamide-phosphate guanylyltransferase [Plebeiobacterium marinum]MCW3805406.1 bifunctional adenosylcobinamide kinase/adenosylcobinamide-phosphate guanylyltransferase [Plebeiobacterium marinum]